MALTREAHLKETLFAAFKGLVLAGSVLGLTTAPFWINKDRSREG